MAKTPETSPPSTKSEQLCEWVGIAVVLGSAFIWVALVSHDAGDWGGMVWPSNSEIVNKGSKVGAALSWFLLLHLGIGSFLVATIGGLWGGAMFLRKKTTDPFFKAFGAAMVVLSACTLASLATPMIAADSRWHNSMTSLGGLYGEAGARLLKDNLGGVGAVLAVLFVMATSTLIATDWLLLTFFMKGQKALEGSFDATWGKVGWRALAARVASMFERKPAPATPVVMSMTRREVKPVVGEVVKEEKAPVEVEVVKGELIEEEAPVMAKVDVKPEPKPEPVRVVPAPLAIVPKPEKKKEVIHKPNPELPPLTLLEDVEVEIDPIDHESRMTNLGRALDEFEVSARIIGYESGPVVTMYEIDLGPGVRLNKVQQLAPDLGIKIGVPNLRIVAPLPGKSTIGIEVPNPKAAPVRLKNIIQTTEETWRKLHLPLFLGMGATGKPVINDLQEMPHLLVAGTTGAGKSVCLTTMILSMLLTRTSDELKLILVDPKQVELSAFKDVPHLMAPVVTDMRRAPAVLDWVIAQMEERYSLFASVGVKKLEQFNALGAEKIHAKLAVEGEEPPDVPTHLPYIVVVIDELADLMMVSAKEVEAGIQRLSQKSRAVGIHMVLATQRPSVDVITGLIKSNMPSRISFKVAAMVDSRTILDQPGAEKLLGKGDMLLMINGNLQLNRGQCTYVPDEEAMSVITWLRDKGGAPTFDADLTQITEAPAGGEDGEGGSERDELFHRAAELIILEGRGSVSLLQRKLEIGFSRAGKLMDQLQKARVVGPQVGAKAREILVTIDAWRARNVTADEKEAAAV